MTQDSWQNQGRQEHGWWGHGTTPHDDKPAETREPATEEAHDAVYRPQEDRPPLMLARAPLSEVTSMLGFADEPLAPGLRGGPGALAAVAALAAAGYGLYELLHDYDHRRIRSVPVVDHPKIVAIVDKQQRLLALAFRGAPGTTLTWRLRPVASPNAEDGYPPAFTILDENGTVMGSYYSTDEVLLSDAGERAVAQAGVGLETRNQEERNLVDSLRAQGKSDAEIQLQLDLRRARRRSSIDRRNVGLPPALRTYPRNARSAATGKNPDLKAAIENGDVSVEEIEAHHLIPMEGVRAYPELFEGAAREGWRPDDAGNVTAQPNSDPAQERIYKATKQQLGTHFYGHPEWNKMVREKLKPIWENIKLKYPSESGPDFDRECKRRVDLLQEELSRMVPKDHISMRETMRRFA